MRGSATLRLALAGTGRLRVALLVLVTAAVGALGLVGCAYVMLGASDGSLNGGMRLDGSVGDGLIDPIADPGLRPGAIFGLALTLVPIVLVLDQAVRLGTSHRRTRYAALAVAGAGPRELRRWGAIEVGVPVAIGAIAAWPAYLVLYVLLGVALRSAAPSSALVPTSVGPGPLGLFVSLALVIYGILAGGRAGARLGEPLPVARGVRPAPRPWGVVPLVGGVVLASLLSSQPYSNDVAYLVTFAAAALLILGLAGLVPWTARHVALRVGRRTSDAATLLAAQRLAADPRPAGRAAAAVGGVVLVIVTAAQFIADVLAPGTGADDAAYYVQPAVLVVALAVLGAALVALALALHGVETLLERRREWAALVAVGVPAAVVLRSLRLEALLATLPVAVLTAVLGSAGVVVLFGVLGESELPQPWAFVGGAAAVGVVTLAVWASSRALRRPVMAGLGLEQLRTT